MEKASLSHHVKIIDFGQSFTDGKASKECHTPMTVRAPEIILGDMVDHRMDLWSMGCMLHEPVAGQPPFDDFWPTEASYLVHQVLQTVDEELPARWQEKWGVMDLVRQISKKKLEVIHGIPLDEDIVCQIQDWLEQAYFEERNSEDLDRADIERIGALIRKMLRLEPSTRASAKHLLQDTWLQER
ncbi:hypothetical protein E8E11_000245 [Didymella keratinophila]|nr:hypothetical protein E8E11_000245 [Didymella keratinophila]